MILPEFDLINRTILSAIENIFSFALLFCLFFMDSYCVCDETFVRLWHNSRNYLIICSNLHFLWQWYCRHNSENKALCLAMIVIVFLLMQKCSIFYWLIPVSFNVRINLINTLCRIEFNQHYGRRSIDEIYSEMR